MTSIEYVGVKPFSVKPRDAGDNSQFLSERDNELAAYYKH